MRNSGSCEGRAFMKRFRRRLLNWLTALSLLLTGVTAALWVRGFWVSDRFVCTTPTAQYNFCFGCNRFRFYAWHLTDPLDCYFPTGLQHVMPPRDEITVWEHSAMPDSRPVRVVRRGSSPSIASGSAGYAVPYALTGALGLLPLLRLGPRRRAKAKDSHLLCANCGYDLRATPDRCPECGTATAIPSTSQRRG